MRNTILIFSCEIMKIRKTIIPWAIFIPPVLYGYLNYQLLVQGARHFMKEGSDSWGIFQGKFWPVLLMLFVPLFIALITSVSHFIDNKNNMWKNLYTLPIDKSVMYVSKSLFNLLLIAFLFVLVALSTIPITYCIDYFSDLVSFEAYWSNFANLVVPTTLKAFGGSIFLWALHNWLGYRFENFIISISIALVGSIISMVAMQGWEHINIFPYAFPLLSAFKGSEDGISTLSLSLISGLALFILSVIDQRYFNSGKK